MENKKQNPYATNRGGKIQAPHDTAQGEPRVTAVKGNDLRAGK